MAMRGSNEGGGGNDGLTRDFLRLRTISHRGFPNMAGLDHMIVVMTTMRCIMANGRLGQWLQMLVCVLILLKTEGFYIGITYVQNAVAKGAICLDGSSPADHINEGFGAGINNWLVHFEATNLHFRGARIFAAVIEDLLAKGMKNAANAIISSDSAGGLTSISDIQ
ncbi:hypothetical protein ACSBR2_028890 [Camellia fascicularis]